MSSHARLTIIADGPVGDLPARLVGITGYAIVGPITTVWESGIAEFPGSAQGTKIECMGDAHEVSRATDIVVEWLNSQSETSTVILDVTPSLSTRIDRDSD